MKKKLKQIGRAILGLTLLPIFIAIFFADRIALIFIFWMDAKRLKNWLNDTESFMYSLLRVTTIGVIYAIYKLIKMWLF